MTKSADQNRGTIEQVDESPSVAERLLLVPNIDDQTLLESMREVGRSSARKISRQDAINSVIADIVLRLKIQEGSKIVLPTAGIIARNFRTRNPKDLSSEDLLNETLVAYRMALAEAKTPRELIDAGLDLGDRATHFTAGWHGSRTISRVMSPEELKSYGRSMARLGYTSALNAAEKNPQLPVSQAVQVTVPTIRKRFSDIIKVVTALMEEPEEVVAKTAAVTS